METENSTVVENDTTNEKEDKETNSNNGNTGPKMLSISTDDLVSLINKIVVDVKEDSTDHPCCDIKSPIESYLSEYTGVDIDLDSIKHLDSGMSLQYNQDEASEGQYFNVQFHIDATV